MEIDANLVIEKLKLIVAEQAKQIAMLEVMVDTLQNK